MGSWGSDKKRSVHRIRTLSTAPPNCPATAPTVVPTQIPISIATTPTAREIRPP